MANISKDIVLKWKELEERKVRVPPDIWERFAGHCRDPLVQMALILRKSGSRGLCIEDTNTIRHLANSIQKFIRGLKGAEDGTSFLLLNVVYLEKTVLDLVLHHVGNDLYKIMLIADTGHPPVALRSEEADRIAVNVRAMKDFITRLDKATR